MDLRAASQLVVEATTRVTEVVQQMHQTIAAGPKLLGQPLAGPVKALTGLVYGSILGVTRGVGRTLDVVLEELEPLLGEGEPGPERQALVAALNGVLGDFLVQTHNPLATPMSLCRHGQPLELTSEALREAVPSASGRLLVLVHGSSMNDLQWARAGHDHGAALERDLGCTTVALRYNSGLHISTNGQAFAAQLEQLVAAWPVPVESLSLLTHSMGGLVARSACHAAEAGTLAWRTKLTSLVFLGTPHQGAPLERGGNWVDTLLGVSRYSAPLARLGKLRSAGVTDLRFGNLLDAHWQGRDRFALGPDPRSPVPLPQGVACFAVAASLSQSSEHPRSDGLVPVDSALGHHRDPALDLGFPPSHQLIALGLGHLDLLSDGLVYEKLKAWLSPFHSVTERG
jgi:hypothetical protein